MICSYCPEGCRQDPHYDAVHKEHALTERGEWICDICYLYDVCTHGTGRSTNGPCQTPEGDVDPKCRHRPRLDGGFVDMLGEPCDT